MARKFRAKNEKFLHPLDARNLALDKERLFNQLPTLAREIIFNLDPQRSA